MYVPGIFLATMLVLRLLLPLTVLLLVSAMVKRQGWITQ